VNGAVTVLVGVLRTTVNRIETIVAGGTENNEDG